MKTFPFFMAFFLMGCTLNLSGQSSDGNSNNKNAESENRKHELGIRISGLDDLKDFDFIYKYQLKSQKYFRLRLASANLRFHKQENISDVWDLGLGVFVGLENRKAIRNDRLFFIHGIQGGLSFGYQSNEDVSSSTLAPSIGYMFGLHYNLNSRFYVNLETTPSLRSNFRFTDGEYQKDFQVRGVYNSSFARFTLAYRF